MGKSSEQFIQEMDDKMYWDTHQEGYDHAQLEMWRIEQERMLYEDIEKHNEEKAIEELKEISDNWEWTDDNVKEFAKFYTVHTPGAKTIQDKINLFKKQNICVD